MEVSQFSCGAYCGVALFALLHRERAMPDQSDPVSLPNTHVCIVANRFHLPKAESRRGG